MPTERFEPSPELERALADLNALAAQAVGVSDPNPRVACRLLLTDGRVFDGVTQAAGSAHAEVMALRAAAAAGAETAGATALVTLEPCSHHGRTPPCCDALLAAGVARVVVACTDPNPVVNGRGLERLRAAGVRVDLLPTDHPLAVATRELNIGFFSRMTRGRPWVRLKLAASLDGFTALADGRSQWITSAAARADGHAWRRRASAVLTGVDTVLADDPRLDVRAVPTVRQPVRVVLDTRLRMPTRARLLAPPGDVWVLTADTAVPAAQSALEAAGARVIGMPLAAPHAGAPLRLDLETVLNRLGEEGINELHVECGATLAGALWAGGWVDEAVVYLAPVLLGQGRGLAQLSPPLGLDQALRGDVVDLTTVGPDVRLRLRWPQRPAPLPHD